MPGGEGDDTTIEAGPLPRGFLIGGAIKAMFRPATGDSLPRTQWARTVRLQPQDYGHYAKVCGFAPEQGVPLTWPYVPAFALQMRLMMAPDFPFSAMGMVHLANRIRQEARLHPGDELRLTCQAGALYAHEKGQAFSVETRAQRDGADIWSCSSIYLARGRGGQGLALSHRPYLLPDQKIASFEASLRTARRYAKVSGDANPIHTSAILARVLGFRRPIAHGMWTKAHALSALTQGAPVDAAEAEVLFRNPLLMPAKAELYASSSGPVCDFDCRSSDGARTYLRGRLSLS